MIERDNSHGNPALALGTISFTVCFAAWGLISAFAPRFRELFHLSATQTALLVAVPVLLGALARIPVGMLADRLGGRLVFAVLMFASAVPVFLVPAAGSYHSVLVVAFFLGLAGSSFAVGVGFVSRWFPPERQGGALGIYGLGNIGQSAAVFGGPLIVGLVGFQNIYRGCAVLLVVWGIVFALAARNAPHAVRPKGIAQMIAVLTTKPLTWGLAAFYFLTFGGFVAFSIYLPSLLRDQFGLSPRDAGFRTAGFVVLATLMRPVGGWLSDRIGGARLLSVVFLAIAPFALLLAWPVMLPFTVGALGCAALLGLGNGAVFKLVPAYFPAETGTVTGLVGAMGGLGGFFPPLLLGFFRDRLGAVWPGFLLLAAASLLLWWLNRRVYLPAEEEIELRLPPELTRTRDRIRSGAWATLWTLLLIAAIVVGSRKLEDFDPALVIYTFAVIFACWGVVYHYNIWIQKPPTRLYWRRGWQIFFQRGMLHSIARIVALSARNLAAQVFIARRSRLRWWMHQCIFWGCLLAVAITFPLVFGWIAFRSRLDDQMIYTAYLFGFPAGQFRVRTPVSWVLFHGLDIAAVLVLTGIFLSLWRRLRDKGAQTVQSFAMDMFPLILLFAISVTGLALTAAQEWLRGQAYSFLAILHAITVIAALLYLPFGKFFHIFQRPAQLGVKLYQEAGDAGEGALCARCGQRYASRMQIEDLKKVLPQLGFDYRLPPVPAPAMDTQTMRGMRPRLTDDFALAGRRAPHATSAPSPVRSPAAHWVELCPACKRKSLSVAQLRLKEESRG